MTHKSYFRKIRVTVPTHFCYFFRARKQRNKNKKRNKNEWVVTKMRKEGFKSFLLLYGIFQGCDLKKIKLPHSSDKLRQFSGLYSVAAW